MQPGTVIDGKYEIVCLLGSGGFGAVYEAVHLQLKRQVAIKMLNTAILQESDGLARFEREAKAIQALQHSSIVAFHAYGVWQGAPYMVMELVQGKSLQEAVNQTRTIEAKRALELMRQVFQALGAAHAVGVVHRDLKPSNIMITQTGNQGEVVKIIDFGLAKLMPGYGLSAQKLTETGMALGSCHYMPPEQALGGLIDQRADIYAAGCILYQIIAGRLPFEGDVNVAIMFQHLNEQATPLNQVVALEAQYEPVATVAKNCMIKDADQRYQKCADVVTDIDHILKGQGSKVTLLSKEASPRKALPRAPLVAVAAVALFLSLGIYWYQQRAIHEQAELAKQARVQHIQAIIRQTMIKESANFQDMIAFWKSGEYKTLTLTDQESLLRSILTNEIAPSRASLPEDTLISLGHDLVKLKGRGAILDTTITSHTFVLSQAALLSDIYEVLHRPEMYTAHQRAEMYLRAAVYFSTKPHLLSRPQDKVANHTSAAKFIDLGDALCKTDPPLRQYFPDAVVLKVLRQTSGQNRERLIRFCREALPRNAGDEDGLDYQMSLVLAQSDLANYRYDEARRLSTFLAKGKDPDLRADGKLLLASLDTIENHLVKAKSEFEALRKDPAVSQANTLTGLARIAYMNRDYTAANKLATEAENLYYEGKDRYFLTSDGRRQSVLVSPRILRILSAQKLGRADEAESLRKKLYAEVTSYQREYLLGFDFQLAGSEIDVGKVRPHD